MGCAHSQYELNSGSACLGNGVVGCEICLPHVINSHWGSAGPDFHVSIPSPKGANEKSLVTGSYVCVQSKLASPNLRVGWDLMNHPHVREWQLFPVSIFQDFPSGLHNHWGLDSRLLCRGAQETMIITRKERSEAKGRWEEYFLHGDLNIIFLVICPLFSVYQELTFETL